MHTHTYAPTCKCAYVCECVLRAWLKCSLFACLPVTLSLYLYHTHTHYLSLSSYRSSLSLFLFLFYVSNKLFVVMLCSFLAGGILEMQPTTNNINTNLPHQFTMHPFITLISISICMPLKYKDHAYLSSLTLNTFPHY